MTTRTTIETLGDLSDHAMSLTWYCAAAGCGRQLGLTLDRAIGLYGADRIYIDWQPSGIKCAGCGCRQTTMIVQAVPAGYVLPGSQNAKKAPATP